MEALDLPRDSISDLPNDGLEIKIRSQALAREVDLLIGSKLCWPRNDCILPWCPLMTMDSAGTPLPSTPYMLLYKTEGESIDVIYDKYKDDAHLQALFIVSGPDSYEPLALNSLQLHDLSLLISIIPRKFQSKILSLAHNTKYLEASVTGFFSGFIHGKSRALMSPQPPKSYYTLFKALQYVIQNGIVVSLSPSIPGICPADETLLVHILEAICYLFVEQHVEFTPINLINQLISFVCHPVYFNSLFPKDFIYFFNMANLYWNESTFYNQVGPFMMECLHHLLLIPVEALNHQLRLFIKQGDFHVDSGILSGTTTLFKMTANSLLSCFKIYYSSRKTAEIIHVFLLLRSIVYLLIFNYTGIKFTVKEFNEYNSGFNLEDVSSLDKGLQAMTVILDGYPQLTPSWKEFRLMFSPKKYSFEIIWKFISVSVRHLVSGQDDESFRVDFLQSLTATCLDVSLKKKAATHFNVSNVMQEGTEFLTYLIHLINEHKWNQKDYEKILEDWLMIVFNLIDLSDVENRNELIKFITTNEKKLWNHLESFFYRQLEDSLSKWCHNLPVEDLISIINVVESEQFNKPKVLMMLSTEPRNPMSKGILTALSQKLFGESDDAYQPKFKCDDRVAMESGQGELVTGTVRWVGLVRASKIESKSSAIGIETDNIIDPLNDFPGLSLNVIGKLFKVSPGHSCIFLPEGVVKFMYEEVKEEINNEELNHESESSHQAEDGDNAQDSKQIVPNVLGNVPPSSHDGSPHSCHAIVTKEVLQKIAIEKQRISGICINQQSLSFDGFIAALQHVHEKDAWFNTHFDQLLHSCEELIDALDESRKIIDDIRKESSQLEGVYQEELLQLRDDLIKKEEENNHLKETNNKLTTSYQIMEETQEELGMKLEDTRSSMISQQKEHQKLKKSYDELIARYQDMEKSHYELVKEMKDSKAKYTSERDELVKKVNTLESSWKISHTDIKVSGVELGRGGWGVVYVGQFRGQKVAVKQIHEFTKSTHYIALLHREVATMSQLRHPNLLQFIGAVFDDPSGYPMIITEVMDTSLRKAYESKELTPDPSCRPVILSILHDVAVGLNYLHCLPDPIIHRDVSSANVLLESKGPVKWKTKVSDFGSANSVTKAPGAVVYSAPEAHQTVATVYRKQTTKMDSFSYGVLFCEVLVCNFPSVETFPDLLEQVEASSPQSLLDVIVSCIEEDPDKRPSMQQILQVLNLDE